VCVSVGGVCVWCGSDDDCLPLLLVRQHYFPGASVRMSSFVCRLCIRFYRWGRLSPVSLVWFLLYVCVFIVLCS